MKYKLLIAITLLTILFGTGITYSILHSGTVGNTPDQKIARFVFDAKKTDHLEFSYQDFRPGDTESYNFSVSNNFSSNISHVTLNYQIIIKTFHFMPLNIELFKINNESEKLIMTCDEKYTRDANHKLTCNSEIQKMDYDSLILDNYKLKVTFDNEYNSYEYSQLVDYIDIEIKSWQKTSE